jgi:hypothetical protein
MQAAAAVTACSDVVYIFTRAAIKKTPNMSDDEHPSGWRAIITLLVAI